MRIVKMDRTEQLFQQTVSYYFLKSKDVHVENGKAFITLFNRLTRETTFKKAGKKQTQIQAIWADTDEMAEGHASEKVRALPNCMQCYELTPIIFYSLYELAEKCPAELFFITPYHLNATRKNFIT